MSQIDLYQGDCLEVMQQLIDKGIKVDAVMVDPPYEILNKKCKWDKMIDISSMWNCLNLLTDKTSPMLLFAQEPYASYLISSNDNFKYKWYWEKTQATGFLNAKKQPLRCIEEILVFYEKQCMYNPQKTDGHKPINSYTKYLKTVNKSVVYGNCSKEISGGGNTDRFPRNHLIFKSDKQTCYLHPTQKPLALMEYLIKTYTNEGDTGLDFCMGSGTTGLACKNLNRNFIGIELDENYFNIAKERING